MSFYYQSESAAQANDLSHALTVITMDLRKLESKEVAVIANRNEITVNDEEGSGLVLTLMVLLVLSVLGA